MKKSVVFIFRSTLHGSIKAQEFLDVVMMAAAFDQKVSLVFIGDGVYALLNNQRTDSIGIKNVCPVMQALSIYDVNDLYIDQQSMHQRAVSAQQLLLPVETVVREKTKQIISSADHVLSF